MGINTKLKGDINSPDFSTCLLLIQLVWVDVDLTSYHSLNRLDIKSHNRRDRTRPTFSGLTRQCVQCAQRPLPVKSSTHSSHCFLADRSKDSHYECDSEINNTQV